MNARDIVIYAGLAWLIFHRPKGTADVKLTVNDETLPDINGNVLSTSPVIIPAGDLTHDAGWPPE